MKKVLFFGIYDPNYSRNSVLQAGFRGNGWFVGECRVDPRQVCGFKKYLELFKKGLVCRREDWDLILVGFPGQVVVPIAKLLFFKRKIVFDAFVSFFDSNVYDRKKYLPCSLPAVRDWLIDWLSTRLADVVLLDTGEHIKYFSQTFRIPLNKFIRVPVGSNPEIFFPVKPRKNPEFFTVHFHGTYIPLQGIEYIVEAARILRDKRIRFNVIGRGQIKNNIVELVDRYNLKNINFVDWVAIDKLSEKMCEADLCLGIFGSTPKTGRVIPNKVFEALACACPVLTADTPAIREEFTDDKILFFCQVANGVDLADKINYCYEHRDELFCRGQAGYDKFVRSFTPKVIIANLIKQLVGKKIVRS